MRRGLSYWSHLSDHNLPIPTIANGQRAPSAWGALHTRKKGGTCQSTGGQLSTRRCYRHLSKQHCRSTALELLLREACKIVVSSRSHIYLTWTSCCQSDGGRRRKQSGIAWAHKTPLLRPKPDHSRTCTMQQPCATHSNPNLASRQSDLGASRLHQKGELPIGCKRPHPGQLRPLRLIFAPDLQKHTKASMSVTLGPLPQATAR